MNATSSARASIFQWGFHYHIFYAMEAHVPFRMLAIAGSASMWQLESDVKSSSSSCARAFLGRDVDTPRVGGINDCEAKVAKLSLERVWLRRQATAALPMVL